MSEQFAFADLDPNLAAKNRALEWRAKNPYGWNIIQRLALERAEQGKKRIAAKYLLEVARDEMGARPMNYHGDPFKVNNNLAPAIARILIEEHPHLADYFELRPTDAEKLAGPR